MRGFLRHCVSVGTFIPPEGIFRLRLLSLKGLFGKAGSSAAALSFSTLAWRVARVALRWPRLAQKIPWADLPFPSSWRMLRLLVKALTAPTVAEAWSKSPIARNKVSYRVGIGMPCESTRGRCKLAG